MQHCSAESNGCPGWGCLQQQIANCAEASSTSGAEVPANSRGRDVQPGERGGGVGRESIYLVGRQGPTRLHTSVECASLKVNSGWFTCWAKLSTLPRCFAAHRAETNDSGGFLVSIGALSTLCKRSLPAITALHSTNSYYAARNGTSPRR